MAGLTPTQIRLKTGGFTTRKGKVVGGFVLPKDVEKDRKAGNINIVSTKDGIAIKGTAKGRKVISERLKRQGLL